MAEPIWKDYFVDLGAPATSGAGVGFYIYSVDKSATIFQGVSFPRPGASTAIVRVNDICADYIAHYFLEQEDPSMPARPSFRIYATTSDAAVLKDTVEFYNNWSYDPQYDPATDGMNFPVVLTFGPRMYIPVTLYSGSPGTATIYMANGQTFTTTPTKARGGDFNNDFNLDFLREMEYFGDSYVIPLADFPGAVRVVYGGRTWLASDKCPRYALYYANAYGGWDALPVEGKTTEADALTHHDTSLVYDNSRCTARGRKTIVNEIKKDFEFWTGWLNEVQSSKMHNILNSPAVFMHDLERDLIYPVVLTQTTTEYKDTPGRLHAYKIKAELAQDRMRR